MAKRTKKAKAQWWWARDKGLMDDYGLFSGARPDRAPDGIWEPVATDGCAGDNFILCLSARKLHGMFPVGHPLRLRKGCGPIAVELMPIKAT